MIPLPSKAEHDPRSRSCLCSSAVLRGGILTNGFNHRVSGDGWKSKAARQRRTPKREASFRARGVSPLSRICGRSESAGSIPGSCYPTDSEPPPIGRSAVASAKAPPKHEALSWLPCRNHSPVHSRLGVSPKPETRNKSQARSTQPLTWVRITREAKSADGNHSRPLASIRGWETLKGIDGYRFVTVNGLTTEATPAGG
jgi:hypothetical protein